MEAVVLHGGVVGPCTVSKLLWQGPSNCWVCKSSVPLLMLQWMAVCYYAVGYTDSGGDLMLVHSTISKHRRLCVCVCVCLHVCGWVVYNYSLVSPTMLTWSVGVMFFAGGVGCAVAVLRLNRCCLSTERVVTALKVLAVITMVWLFTICMGL